MSLKAALETETAANESDETTVPSDKIESLERRLSQAQEHYKAIVEAFRAFALACLASESEKPLLIDGEAVSPEEALSLAREHYKAVIDKVLAVDDGDRATESGGDETASLASVAEGDASVGRTQEGFAKPTWERGGDETASLASLAEGDAFVARTQEEFAAKTTIERQPQDPAVAHDLKRRGVTLPGKESYAFYSSSRKATLYTHGTIVDALSKEDANSDFAMIGVKLHESPSPLNGLARTDSGLGRDRAAEREAGGQGEPVVVTRTGRVSRRTRHFGE